MKLRKSPVAGLHRVGTSKVTQVIKPVCQKPNTNKHDGVREYHFITSRGSLVAASDRSRKYIPENASKSKDPDIVLVLCHDTEVSLTHVKKAAKNNDDSTMRERIATVYMGLGDLLDNQGHRDEAQVFYKKSEKWGGRVHGPSQPTHPSRPVSIASSIKSAPQSHAPADTTINKPSPHSAPSQLKRGTSIATIPNNIFPRNLRPPTITFAPPEPDSHLNDTRQLACCLGLLQPSIEADEILDPAARTWLQITKNEPDERQRLQTLATDIIRAFKRDEFKDSKAVTEVAYLAPVLNKDDFRYLVKEFYSGVDQSGLLDVHQLEGLAHLIQGAGIGYLDTDDLVKILDLLSDRLRDTHQQSTYHLHRLTLAASHVLDAMADACVTGLDREKIHEPLLSYLDGLKGSSDTYLVYQAAYAYQALMCVPDDETLWQATLRRSRKVVQGVSGLVSAVKGLDLNGFIEGLEKIQEGLEGASGMYRVVRTAYNGAVSLAEGGQGFFTCLKEGLSFERKCAWYTALRGADALIQDGQFAEFKKLVCEAPCLRDPAFQWGVCQRLGEVAASSEWESETRQHAIAFLVEIYQNDAVWGDQANVKQWIVGILMQLSSPPGGDIQFVEMQLQELQKNGDVRKQELFRTCLKNGPETHPLKIGLAEIGSPSLLDRVQERPDVEGSLRQLRRLRLKDRANTVYIPPQAKAGLQAGDEARFPLMEKVDEFLSSDRMVFLLLGDSGAGKSTFSRELECHLWQTYQKGGTIPLHINLPAIDKPEHDMIAKQLRKAEFTEPQIRELKFHRKFLLICDGYDESQQTHNLYKSNHLNQTGEWNAKMVISCRSEYLGVDYRDRFQPGDRNSHFEQSLFQEAAIAQFSPDQVQDYITQYVLVHRPLWEADDYRKALDLIPSLKELAKNPFLMSLSLEVLPRMVDHGQDLSTTHITRMALYDQFIEHWFERGKKRLGEKNLSPQARSAFESLIDEGFTRNGIDYLKKLCKAIYKEQRGQPIVTYSRYKDENSWKAPFFSRDEEQQILREACPLIRNGNQYRFIHRSLLEYGIALAIFDPQDWKEIQALGPTLARRGSVGSVMSIDGHETVGDVSATIEQEPGPDLNSPLVWRRLVSDSSVIQFLEERVRQEPLFKEQLQEYVEQSKKDKRWRTAAANAITILVRAGVQFNHADLRGIRVPHADLSFGMFDSAQFQGADLRHVDMSGAWLRRANLSNAQMTGVQFGELPFLKQDSEVTSCVYSPDGKTFAVELCNGKIKVYSTLSFENITTLESHSHKMTSIVYSPDSNRIASCSSDHTVRLWDVKTGICIRTLNGHAGSVRSVVYSPQGDQLASASDDSTIKMWDMETGEFRHTWIGHTDSVQGVIFSPDGNQIASYSADRIVRLWSISTKKCLHTLRGHGAAVTRVVYSPSGDQVSSASDDRTVRLWDLPSGQCRHVLTGHNSSVIFVTYSPNGNQVASSSRDKSVRLWDTDRGVCLHILQGHTNWVRQAVYSPQGDVIASASDDTTVRLWDSTTGICQQTLTGHTGFVMNVVFSPRGDQFASSGEDKTVRLWSVGAGMSIVKSSGHMEYVWGVSCSPRGDQVATCSEDRTVRLWDVETGDCRHILRGHTRDVSCVVYSTQGDQIATGSYDSTIRLWNMKKGACIRVLKGHINGIYTIAYSPEGDQLVSAAYDQSVRLWDVNSGECLHVLTGHTSVVISAGYSRNGNQVLSCSYDSTMRIWDAETGSCNYTLTGHSKSVNRFACSPQDDQVASASEDTTVRVWDVGTGECRHILIGHNCGVVSIAYSPRGDQITSGGSNGSVKVWDAESGDCLWTFTGHSSWVYKVVYLPRGDLVVSASSDSTVRLWDVSSGQYRAVIQDFQAGVNSIAWMEASDANYLFAGCADGVVGAWKVLLDGDHCEVSLRWMTTKGVLDVKDTTVQDVQGLSHFNRQLLKQRGAIGESASRLRETSKKVNTMASVVSKLQSLSNNTAMEDPALRASGSLEQLGKLLELAKDPLVRDMMSVMVKNFNRDE